MTADPTGPAGPTGRAEATAPGRPADHAGPDGPATPEGFREAGRHRVAVLVRHGLLPIELGIAHRVMGDARTAAGEPLYEVLTCATAPGMIRTTADFAIEVRYGPRVLAEADTVIVPASHEEDTTAVEGRLPPRAA